MNLHIYDHINGELFIHFIVKKKAFVLIASAFAGFAYMHFLVKKLYVRLKRFFFFLIGKKKYIQKNARCKKAQAK